MPNLNHCSNPLAWTGHSKSFRKLFGIRQGRPLAKSTNAKSSSAWQISF